MLEVLGSIPMASAQYLVSEHASPCFICRDDINTVRIPSDQDVNWRPTVQGQSPPVQIEEPYFGNLIKQLLVALGSSCKNTGVYNVHLPSMSVRAYGSI